MLGMIRKNFIVDSYFYELVLERKRQLETVLAMVMDEYLTTYSKLSTAPLVCGPMWAPEARNMSIGELEELWERDIVLECRKSLAASEDDQRSFLAGIVEIAAAQEEGRDRGEEGEMEEEEETRDDREALGELPPGLSSVSGSSSRGRGGDDTMRKRESAMREAMGEAVALKEEGNEIF